MLNFALKIKTVCVDVKDMLEFLRKINCKAVDFSAIIQIQKIKEDAQYLEAGLLCLEFSCRQTS